MIEVGVPALKTISLSFLGAAFGIINSTLFQATARGMNSLIVSVCRQLVVILPAAWILGQQFGLNAVWSLKYTPRTLTAVCENAIRMPFMPAVMTETTLCMTMPGRPTR